MPDDLFKIDDPLADTEEDTSIDEPNGVPSLASPSVKRPAPLKVIEADPEFKALTPVQKRQVMYRWVNAMPEMQGLDEHSKQSLINRAQSRFPDEPSGVPGGIGGTLGVRNFYEMTPSQTGNLSARGKISSFGGPFDKEDNGRTASGNTTFDKPNAHYVALPEAVRKQYNIPWNTPVTITNPKTGKSVTAPLWDHGPAGWTGRRIDVSPATLKALGANTDDTVEFSVGGKPMQQVRGVQSPKSAGKGSLPFTPSPQEFNVARDIFAPAGSPAQAPSAAPAPPSVDPALVKGQYDRFLNTDNPTANIPMATAVRLSSLPSEQRATDTQLLRMNPVTQAAILQKAHELAANKNWRMNTSMGPATPTEEKRFDLLKGDPKAIAEATAGEANRNILNAAMYYAGLPKAAVQNVLLGLTAGLFPETMSPEQKKNYAKLQRLPHIQQLQYLMAQPVGRELEPNQEAARQSAIDRKVYQGSIPVETLMAAGSGAAIDPLMWGAVGPKLAMRVLEGSAAKVGAKGVAKALASPVAQGAAHTATSAAFAAGSARGLFDPKLWEENPTEAFIQTLFTAAATLGAMHGGLQMRGALKDAGAQNRSYEDAMKRAIHSRTIPDEQMPSDVQSPGVNVQGSSVVPTMPGEATETQSGVPTTEVANQLAPQIESGGAQVKPASDRAEPATKKEWVEEVLNQVRAGTQDWPYAPSGVSTRDLLNAIRGPWKIWTPSDPTPDLVVRKSRGVNPNATVQAEQIQEAATPHVPVGETGQTRAGGGGGESQSDQLQGAPGKGREATQVSQPEAVGVVSLNPRDIQIDPERFQFKVGASEKGTTGSLSSSSRWRPELAGTLLVWKDPSNGKTYVVNGHNRLSLANRSGASSVDARYINDIAPTPEIARRVGAIANIAEGRGTPIDAAKLFREEGVTPEGLRAEGVSMTEANARNGLALARLPEGLWRSVFRGEMPVERGVAIGEGGLNQGQMMQLHQMVESAEKRGKRLTPGEVGELGKIITSAGEAEVTTSSLFGDETKSMGLAVEMARLVSALKYKLSKDARLFGFVSRGERATELERGGNKIDIKNSKQLAQQSAQVGEIFDRLAYRSGPINNALRDAAARIAKGENPHGVQEYLYERTSTIVRDILSGKETERGAGHEVPPTEQPHTATDLFSESESAPYTPQSVETTTPSVEPVSISPKPIEKPAESGQIDVSAAVEPVSPKPETTPPAELPTARESVKAFQEESRTGKAIEALDALEQAAKERLKKRNKGRLSSGIDPLDLADYALAGAAKIGKGIVRFADWSAEMVRDFGEGVKPHLDALWEYSKRAYDNHVRPSLGENAPIPEENAPKTAEVQSKPRRVKEPEGMEGVTGVAKVVTRRNPQKGISKQELFEMGRDAVVSNRIDPKKVADRTLQSGKPMSDEELAAIGYQLRKIEDARDAIVGEIDKTKDPAALADLDSLLAHHDAESNHLLDAADLTLNKGFHRLGMAAQIALDKTHSLRTLPQRAKAALLGTEAPSGMEEKLKSFMNENSKLQSDLKKVREELAQAYEDKKATTPKPRSERQRNADIKRLQQYFGKTQGEIIEPAKRMGRTAGAVRYTLPDADRAAMAAMRRLAADLAPTATDFPDLMDKIRNAIGSSVPDEQIYRMLSEPYRKFMIEADLNRMKANQYVQQIKRQSEFELKTKAQKALTLVGSTVNTAQRSLQAGMDVSAPFIQGRKGLFANLQGWAKSWLPMIESLYRGEDVPMRQMAAIENHPMYSRAKAAGLDLTEVGGKFSQQEEMFAGNLIELLHDKLPGTNKTNPIKLYLQGLKNSEAAYTAFLNGIRWDTFVKLAKVDPENPAYLRDVASTINTIYGRGAGRTAKSLGSTSLAGNLMFAPRNLMASLEYAGGRPVLFAETAAGRKQAMKIYAAQAASYGTLVVLARLAGWNVGLDPRSSDFGKVEIGGAKYDLFAKEAQAYRLLTQILYGRVGETGKFTPPKGHTGEFIGNFLVNKAAPSPKLAYEFFEGKLVKKPNGGFDSRPLELRDLAWGLTPFWVSKAAEDGTLSEMPAILLPNIAGEDVEPGTVSQKSVKADWTKPGIFMPKSNAATEARLRRSVNSAGKTR